MGEKRRKQTVRNVLEKLPELFYVSVGILGVTKTSEVNSVRKDDKYSRLKNLLTENSRNLLYDL